MIILLMFLGTILASGSIMSSAAKAGYFNGALTRTVAGGSVTVASSTFLTGYTNLESYINAAAVGNLGFSGYVFIGGLAALIITWISNLVEYEVAVK